MSLKYTPTNPLGKPSATTTACKRHARESEQIRQVSTRHCTSARAQVPLTHTLHGLHQTCATLHMHFQIYSTVPSLHFYTSLSLILILAALLSCIPCLVPACATETLSFPSGINKVLSDVLQSVADRRRDGGAEAGLEPRRRRQKYNTRTVGGRGDS